MLRDVNNGVETHSDTLPLYTHIAVTAGLADDWWAGESHSSIISLW